MYYGDAATPDIGEDQVLIKNRATSVNAPDIIQREGKYPPPVGESEILGLEVAGIVEKAGVAVSRYKAGERVMALLPGGGYAQYSAVHHEHVMAIPDALSFEQAACVCETYLTAYLNLFILGQVKDGQRILLHGGGGGVNSAAIQLCRHLLAGAVLFVTASPAKVARVKALGVDHVIDYQNQSFVDEIAALSANKGVDVILDHIGGPYFQDNMKSLAVAGKLLQIGVSGGVKSEVNLALMMVKRQQIIGSVLRPRSIAEKAAMIRRFSGQVLPLMEEGVIAPVISDVFPLQRAGDAHRLMHSGGHFGKIVLQID